MQHTNDSPHLQPNDFPWHALKALIMALVIAVLAAEIIGITITLPDCYIRCCYYIYCERYKDCFMESYSGDDIKIAHSLPIQ